MTVIIVKKGDTQAGLVVDNLIGQQEIVIKSLGKYINGNKLISGAITAIKLLVVQLSLVMVKLR